MPKKSIRLGLAFLLLLTVVIVPASAQAPIPVDSADRYPVDASGLLSSVPPTSDATDLPVLRLEDLLDEVRSNNPSLRAARLEVDALSTRERQVSALPDPTFMATYQPYSVLTARGAQRSQWRLEQQLPFPGKLALRGEIADISTHVAAREADAFEYDLAAGVKRTYYELFLIQAQIALVHTFQGRLEQFEAAAVQQYEVGTGMQQAILKAQLEKNGLSQRLIDLSERWTTAVERLSRLVDRPIEGEFQVETMRPPIAGLEVEALVERAIAQRPEMHAVEAAARRADKQIDLARREFMPDFGLNLTYFDIASGTVPPSATGRDAVAVGASIKIPLQRDRLRAQLEEAQARRAQIDARRDALRTSFRTQITDLVKRLQFENEQLELYRTLLIPQAESTINATLSAYTTGRTDFLNLLDAERMLFTLRMNRESAQARLLKAAADLERELAVDTLSALENF